MAILPSYEECVKRKKPKDKDEVGRTKDEEKRKLLSKEGDEFKLAL
jgi:hypothetical protein